MTYEYGQPPIAAYLGEHKLFSGSDASQEDSWQPSEPEESATLWRYMSFPKFCSLLDHKALFFALVGNMADSYEGFIYPPEPRERTDPLKEPEEVAHQFLQRWTRSALVCCWTEAEHESSLMWEAYAGAEGVAIRTTFQDLRKAIFSVGEPPITFGRVDYVDYAGEQVPRLGWAPLFHKRVEYRAEDEIRAVLPGPRLDPSDTGRLGEPPDIPLDPDVERNKGRYVPVDIATLVRDVVLPPRAAPWFARVVESVIQNSPADPRVTPSVI
ncbi:MAG: DUF2971 domain-containing protein [Chloroflexi bacterium]|nr:DUF2971 domain-containing protein [Chloroflexota bacterium]MYK62130.1 DUF2971 domain-containing protein [Chloroflexota bacterium]